MREDVKQYIINRALLTIESLDDILPEGTSEKLYQDFTSKVITLSNNNNLLSFLENYPLDLYKEYYLFQRVLRKEITISDWLKISDSWSRLESKKLDYSYLKLGNIGYNVKVKENALLASKLGNGLKIEEDEGEIEDLEQSESSSDSDSENDDSFDLAAFMSDLDISKYATLSRANKDKKEEYPEEVIGEESSDEDAKSDDESQDNKAAKSQDTTDTNSEEVTFEDLADEDIESIFDEVDNKPILKSGFIILDEKLSDADILSMIDDQIVMLVRNKKIAVPEDIEQLNEHYRELVKLNDLEGFTAPSDAQPSFESILSSANNLATESNQENSPQPIEKNLESDKLYRDAALNDAAERIMNKLDTIGILDKMPDLSVGSK